MWSSHQHSHPSVCLTLPVKSVRCLGSQQNSPTVQDDALVAPYSHTVGTDSWVSCWWHAILPLWPQSHFFFKQHLPVWFWRPRCSARTCSVAIAAWRRHERWWFSHSLIGGELRSGFMLQPALEASQLLKLLSRIKSCCQISAPLVNCTPHNLLTKSLIAAGAERSQSGSSERFCICPRSFPPLDLKVFARMNSGKNSSLIYRD